MVTLIAAEVALGFATANERKAWKARPYATNEGERVIFSHTHGLVSLVLECNTRRFEVRFNKVQASWGDYVRAVNRTLHIVLSTLKAAGLPFDGPDPDEPIAIAIEQYPDGNATYARWLGDEAMGVDIKPDKPMFWQLSDTAEASIADLRPPADEPDDVREKDTDDE